MPAADRTPTKRSGLKRPTPKTQTPLGIFLAHAAREALSFAARRRRRDPRSGLNSEQVAELYRNDPRVQRLLRGKRTRNTRF